MPDNFYWTNLKLGKSVKKKPLPEYKGNSNIVFQNKSDIEKSLNIIKKEDLFNYFNENERKVVEKIYENLKVKKHLHEPHKFIEEHKAFWLECVKNKMDVEHIFKGLFDNIPYNTKFKNKKIIDTYSVSKGQIRRAYLIYDCLIKAFEQCGFNIKVNSNYATILTIRDEEIQLRMREKYNKVEIDVDKYNWRSYEYNPKGELVFMFKTSMDYNYCEISDGKKKFLEDKVQTIFKKICDKVESVKIENKKREEDRIKYEIQRKKEESIKEIHDEELTKMQALLKEIKLFEIAEKIRKYANALQQATNEEKEYCQWVNKKADWLDPNINYNDDILNDGDKYKLIEDNKENIGYYKY